MTDPNEEFKAAIDKVNAEKKATVTTDPAPPTPPADTAVPPDPNTPPTVSDPAAPPVDPPATDPNAPQDPAVKNLLDLLKPVAPTADPNITIPPVAELSDEVKEKLRLADEYEKIQAAAKEGNLIALAVLAGDSPEKIQELAKSLIPEDLSYLSYEQLIKRDFEKQGLTGELLENAVKDTMAEYDTVPDWKKGILENEMKAKFKPTSTQNPYLEQYKASLAQNQPPAPPDPAVLAKVKESDIAAITSIIDSFDGAEMFGFKFDKNTIGKEIIEAYDDRSIQPYIKPDNTLDAQGWAIKTMWEKHGPKIAQAAYEQGRLDEKKGNALPNSARQNGAAPTNITNPPTQLQKVAALLNDPDFVNKKV